ncbi:DUF4191 domain-containing protein [Georgenia halophila]
MARKKSDGATDAAPVPEPEKKQRWYHNVRDAYQMTRRVNPAITWILIGVFVLTMGLALAIGFAWGHPIYMAFFGLLLSLTLLMAVLAWQTRKSSYKQIDGRPGAVGAVLGQIRRGWNLEQEPVAVNPRTQDMVFRMIGKAGIVLVSEGPSHRAGRLLNEEKRKVSRVAPNVPVHTVQYGNEEGQVPISKLTRTVQKLDKKLTSAEVAQVSKRMQALGSAKPPVPKGVDPMKARPDRKAMKGR